jgi:hypothetical protein
MTALFDCSEYTSPVLPQNAVAQLCTRLSRHNSTGDHASDAAASLEFGPKHLLGKIMRIVNLGGRRCLRLVLLQPFASTCVQLGDMCATKLCLTPGLRWSADASCLPRLRCPASENPKASSCKQPQAAHWLCIMQYPQLMQA